MKKEYIEGKEKYGLEYDYDLIRREYKKLRCPDEYYNPTHLPFERSKWFISMSERARGKTTNVLLLGMIFNKHYGTEIQYIRSREEMIAPKISHNLFGVITDNGYIEKITDGEYNTVVYKSRRWYYAHYDDESGEITKQASRHLCSMLAIDKNEMYKSSYSAPLGDFIIFDEFIERFYYPQQFVMFLDLLSTIIRSRKSASIFLLSNTIDKNSPYFSEFEIRDAIDDLDQGEYKLVTTPKGTNVFVEIIGKRQPKASRHQKEINKLYYGFQNSKLASITGEAAWAVDTYPHTPKEFNIISKNHYLEFNTKLVNLEICYDEEHQRRFINCHYATNTYDDSVIYSLDFNLDKRYRYKLGTTKIDQYIWRLYHQNLFTYSDNSVGSLIERYVELC